MLSNEPSLEFIRAQNLADQQVIGSVIAGFIGLPGHRPHLFEDDFMCFEDARKLYRYLLASARRAWNDRRLGYVVSHRNADAAEKLYAFGDCVYQLSLFAVVFVEE